MVLNERYCNFSRNYCPPSVPLVSYKLQYILFKTGPVKKYWELAEEIEFEISNFETKNKF